MGRVETLLQGKLYLGLVKIELNNPLHKVLLLDLHTGWILAVAVCCLTGVNTQSLKPQASSSTVTPSFFFFQWPTS